ncbi:probable serine/threonine-protein kinase mkcC isoform X3 [Syngnathoides biaculeatus]|uniref:probable serine/threonine-protein kinase mkcC isoform X3 n=1 Tax=Syngnathoides biaculeatus TaxID=300417 RepID=UPI002ADDF23B|nr:probable serine/threonine-protein kinase mkcC isoform X3 [Syngnathoides biaculeatus]
MDEFGIFDFPSCEDCFVPENQENVFVRRKFEGRLRHGKNVTIGLDACAMIPKVSELTEMTLEVLPAQGTKRKADTKPEKQKAKDTVTFVPAKVSQQKANTKRSSVKRTQKARSTLPGKTTTAGVTIAKSCTKRESLRRKQRSRLVSGPEQKTLTSKHRVKAKKTSVKPVQVKRIKEKSGTKSELHTRKQKSKVTKKLVKTVPQKRIKVKSGAKQKTKSQQRDKVKRLPVKAALAKELPSKRRDHLRPKKTARTKATKRKNVDIRQDASRKKQRVEDTVAIEKNLLAKGRNGQSATTFKKEQKGKPTQGSVNTTKRKDSTKTDTLIRSKTTQSKKRDCVTKPETLISKQRIKSTKVSGRAAPPRGGLEEQANCVHEKALPAEKVSVLKAKRSFLEQMRTILSSSTSRTTFEKRYEKFAKIGEGGFGSVYAGHRKMDYNPVAIKYIPKAKVKNVPLSIDGKVQKVPLEAIFMLQASSIKNSDGKSAVVSLLNIYDLEKEVVLVMERPVHSVALSTYLTRRTLGLLEEDEAKYIMRQLVDAAIKMHAANIFHRDLKQENILLEASPGVTRVRVIDFGCSCLVSMEPYRDYFGTLNYAPPEYKHNRPYCAGPTTVWHLGALLFELLDGTQRFDTCVFLSKGLQLNRDLSEDCGDLLWMCLSLEPTQRCTLDQMQWHPWLL